MGMFSLKKRNGMCIILFISIILSNRQMDTIFLKIPFQYILLLFSPKQVGRSSNEYTFTSTQRDL